VNVSKQSVFVIALLGISVCGYSDIRPDTRSRIAWPTRDEFAMDEDRSAYDRPIAARPQFAKAPDLAHEEPGNGIRLHIPIVHIAYRDTIQNLNQKNGLQPRYQELATLVACWENKVEFDWVNHLTHSAAPLDIVEVVRANKDTSGLDEKDAVLIHFGRELFRQPKVSSETFGSMERLFGKRGTLALTLSWLTIPTMESCTAFTISAYLTISILSMAFRP